MAIFIPFIGTINRPVGIERTLERKMELFQNKNNLISFSFFFFLKTVIFIPFIGTINRPVGIERTLERKMELF